VSLSSDGCMVACGCGSELVVYDLCTGEMISFCRGHKCDPVILSVCFGCQDKLLAVSSGNEGGCVEIFHSVRDITDSNIESLSVEVDLGEDYNEWCRSVVFHDKKNWLAMGLDSGTLLVVDACDAKEVPTQIMQERHAHSGMVSSVAWSAHDEKDTLVSCGSYDNKVCIWDVSSGTCTRQIKPGTACDVACFVQGLVAVGLSYGTVSLWDISTHDAVVEIARSETPNMQCVIHSMSSLGRLVLTASSDGSICIFSLTESGKLEKQEIIHQSDAVHGLSVLQMNDHVLVASGGGNLDRAVRLYKVQ
jgi:WD40 repeat protein